MLRRPLPAAAACAGLALVVYLVAYEVHIGREADALVRNVLVNADDTPAELVAELFLLVMKTPVYALGTLLLVGAVAVRRGWMAAAVAAAVIGAANLTTQLLKPALAEPRVEPEVDPAAWPSGHATAAAATAFALVLLLPAEHRRWALVLPVGVGWAVAAMGWHYPSDVFAGWLVAGFYGLLGWALLRRPASAPAPTGAPRRADSPPAPG